jgi:hypothetical protein
MEISPISGILALPAEKAPQADLRPSSFFDVIASAKPGDESGQGSRRKAAGAEENDPEDESADLMLDDEIESPGEAREQIPARQIDYFA